MENYLCIDQQKTTYPLFCQCTKCHQYFYMAKQPQALELLKNTIFVRLIHVENILKTKKLIKSRFLNKMFLFCFFYKIAKLHYFWWFHYKCKLTLTYNDYSKNSIYLMTLSNVMHNNKVLKNTWNCEWQFFQWFFHATPNHVEWPIFGIWQESWQNWIWWIIRGSNHRLIR